MLSSPVSQEHSTTNPLTGLMNSISSYDGNVMLAAVISLLLVILFVLLLHIYAKWFLAQARQRRQSSISVSHQALRPTRFHSFNSITLDASALFSSSPSKGLDASLISSIPLFIHKADDNHQLGSLECVICLSAFEENEVGRNLPKCGHKFHVECIDMWLQSHCNCPICRAPVFCESSKASYANNDDMSSMERGSSESLGVVSSEVVAWTDGESRVELVVSDIVSNYESEDAIVNDLLSASSSSSASSSTLSSSLGSLKRMLSRNRSEHNKVFPAATVGQSEV